MPIPSPPPPVRARRADFANSDPGRGPGLLLAGSGDGDLIGVCGSARLCPGRKPTHLFRYWIGPVDRSAGFKMVLVFCVGCQHHNGLLKLDLPDWTGTTSRHT